MNKLEGIPASDGLAIGPVFVYQPGAPSVERRAIGDPAAELARFDEALVTAEQQLEVLKTKVAATVGAEEAQIFEAHRLFLSDPMFAGAIRQAVETDRINVEAAIARTVDSLVGQFKALDNPYFQERAADVADVGQRLLRLLTGWGENSLAALSQPAIILAADLTPSDTAALDRAMVLAFCTSAGGVTSHTAILARSLGIPAVAGLGERLFSLAAAGQLLVDGYSGAVIMDPDPATINSYQAQHQVRQQRQNEALTHAAEPAITADGQPVAVWANIGNLADARQALKLGAEGVGLLRTEFLFLQGDKLPDEEEQYKLYRAIADLFQQRPLIVRTLDVGGDKPLPALDMPAEENPFLGRRAIRLSLAEPELFQTQLRAILRAGYDRNLQVMFPMISSVGELRRALAALDQAKASLEVQAVPYVKDIKVGIMVEIPSAALLADVLAPLVDFFSIGTNDLTQYTLAVDRTNPLVAELADSLHPAVLRLIRQVIQAGQAAGKEVGMCGELAGNLLAIPLLLGMGLREFSMTAPAIPAAKAVIRSLSVAQTEKLVDACLKLGETEEVYAFLKAAF